MVTLEHDRLVFRFPDIHRDAVLGVEFERTLRIPDDDDDYPLPPGLGAFPLAHVDDYSERVPATWLAHGGVFLPMYQSEALWLSFNSGSGYPFAVKIAAGKINALTGECWKEGLSDWPQDYLVAPDQPWLDGFCVEKGTIRQFVAMPLGEGYTAEEQLTGSAEHGGLQIIVYPLKAKLYQPEPPMFVRLCSTILPECAEMGLAPGGRMRQEIYDDRHGLAAWERSASSRCFVHILNSLQYQAVTGNAPPTKPISAADYTRAGLPWFEYYDADQKAIEGAAKLAGLKSVAAKKKERGRPLSGNESVEPKVVKKLGPQADVVREGEF